MEILGTIFFCAWFVGVISFFGAVIEMYATARFWDLAYSIGIKVIDERIDYASMTLNNKDLIAFGDFKAKPASKTKMYFRQNVNLLKYRLSTPFPIKGVIIFDNGFYKFQGRLPLFVSVFMGAALLAWSAGAAMVLLKSTIPDNVMFLVVGWAFVLLIVFISMVVEIPRAKRSANEIFDHLVRRA